MGTRREGRGLSGDGFVALFDGSSAKVLRFFARRVLDAEAAADLTAETFAAALASRQRFDPRRGEPEAWLLGIAQHQLGHYVRHRAVDHAARRALELPIRSPSTPDLERIEELVDFERLKPRIRSVLAELSENHQQAVWLRVVEELAYPQIADQLDCSEQAARARVSRGLREMGLLLAATYDQSEEAIR
jgi:RNA polymerase sigma factor (sigma-70 family)